MNLAIFILKTGSEILTGNFLFKKKIISYIFICHRWKGENISAAEVEALISKVTGNLDATAYGVEIGNLEGRAGMVTIVDPIGQLNLEQLASDVDKCLPVYARPLFIRIAQKVSSYYFSEILWKNLGGKNSFIN